MQILKSKYISNYLGSYPAKPFIRNFSLRPQSL
jgi:hypothetical protein